MSSQSLAVPFRLQVAVQWGDLMHLGPSACGVQSNRVTCTLGGLSAGVPSGISAKNKALMDCWRQKAFLCSPVGGGSSDNLCVI
jgi:hypothetical protein